jgi:hypothetical protein
MRSDCCGLRFVVSHPFAENANGWGTEVLSFDWRRTAGPSTALRSAQDDSHWVLVQVSGR